MICNGDSCTHVENGKRCEKRAGMICPYCRDHVDQHIEADALAEIAKEAERVNRFADRFLASKYKMSKPQMEFILALRAAGGRLIAETYNA